MTEVVTYVEMTARDQLLPSAAVEGVGLSLEPPGDPVIRPLLARVAAPHAWPSLMWTDEQWTAWFAEPRRRLWSVRVDGAPVGVAELEAQQGPAVEIASFGLVPEFVGRGIGGYALTLAIEQAWRFDPTGDGPANRVWLHTSTLDHPHALQNYQRRGFRPYHTETR
ncbi:GNAT family N-acetyltransferase [Fodinicola feengrottensis]|uniref:GNAT family N-acetyltransferase n=1 Tax=Fodinicola feengrottensis TaxID=435914 RepID=A0ABP4TN88_9ACTN